MQAKNYSFFNLPKKCSLADYKEATDIIIDKYSKTKGLLSIYSWGNVSVAGISDIDIVFIFKSDVKPLPFSSRSFYFLDAKTMYLARHPFMFIDEYSFRKIKYIYPDTDFKLLHGKNIKINKISNSDEYYSNIALINDIIIRHYPRDFIEQFVNKRINVRDTLLRLNSLKYSISVLETLQKKGNTDWKNSLKLIENLRKNWFKNKDYGVLIKLNENALDIAIDITHKFKEFLMKNDLVEIDDDIFYNGIKNKTLFVKNWDKKMALVKNNTDYSILPIELAAQLVEYSNFNGLISNYIRKNLNKSPECKLKHKDIVAKRISILNKQAEFAYKLRHSDFPAYFDFGYRNSSGVNNWILRVTDKLRF